LTTLGFWLFVNNVTEALCAEHAGFSGVVVDWEIPDETGRQVNLEIHHSNLDLVLGEVSAAINCPVMCRVNKYSDKTAAEVARALSQGANNILLPMVRKFEHGLDFKNIISGKAKWGLMIETPEALEIAQQLAELEPDFVYVGLFDLMYTREREHLFEPLINGEVTALRRQFHHVQFGVAGLTVIDRGEPIPSLELLKELSYNRCDFTFFRRSFKRDIYKRNMREEVSLLNEAWQLFNKRDDLTKNEDHKKFISLINEKTK
jgi:hypothetical protein